MRRNTFIQVPNDIGNEVILKRFLNLLIEKIDVAFSNRGIEGFVSNNELSNLKEDFDEKLKDSTTTATELDSLFVRLDGSNQIKGILNYGLNQLTFNDNNDIINKLYVDELITKVDSPLPLDITTSTLEEVSVKVNELITKLKDTKVFND